MGWFIVTNPNCSTIALTLTLKPIYDAYNIKRVYVSTMQAVSGAGYNGVPSMAILDNLVPFIGGEEEKIETETLHLLGELDDGVVKPASFGVSASCHRVPVVDGHTEAVFIELDDDFEIDDVREAMDKFRGLPQKLGLHSAQRNRWLSGMRRTGPSQGWTGTGMVEWLSLLEDSGRTLHSKTV